MIKKIFKIILIWIPVSVILFIIIIFVALSLYLTPARVESIAAAAFNKMSYGTLLLKVNKFSLHSGFEASNIVIRNGKEFGETKFAEIDRLALKYSLFSMLIGNIYFEEIGIYKPRIYLKQKDGIWNTARLMKPGAGKQESEGSEKEPAERPREKENDEISLPISVKLLLNFRLDDLRVYIAGDNFNSSAEGLTYHLGLFVPPFKKIPKSLKAVLLLKTMKMELNPKGSSSKGSSSKGSSSKGSSSKGSSSKGSSSKGSSSKGSSSKGSSSKGSSSKGSSSKGSSSKGSSSKGSVDISFSNKEAGVKTPLVFNWKLVFDSNERSKEFASTLRLGAENAPVHYKNTFLAPLNFLISYDMLYNPANDHLKISSLSVSFKNNKWLSLTGDINRISTKPEFNIRITESKIILSELYPYFLSFTGDKRTKFGGTISFFPMAITGNIANIIIEGQLNLRDIYLKNPETETVLSQLKLSYSVKKKNNDISLSAGIDIPSVSVNPGRDKLGSNGISMRLDLSAYNDFQRLDVNNFLLKVFNPDSGRPSLDIALNGDVKMLPDMSGKINIFKFTFQKDNLSDGIKNKYLSRVQLKKPVDLSLDLKFVLAGNQAKADLGMLVKVPDYDINDLRIDAVFAQDKKAKRIRLDKFAAGSRDFGVKIGAAGWIDTAAAPFSDSDIRITAELDSPKMKPVYGPWNLSGMFKFDLNMKGDIKTGKTSGSIQINKLFVKNRESLLSIEDINMDFPFEYKFASGPVKSRIAVDKAQLIDNENFKERENFTVKSVKAEHPVRNTEIEYARDFSATLFFRNNAFEITKMKMYVLNGAVYGRDILFYLADMPATRNFKNVEYKLTLDAVNVDIERLRHNNPDKKEKSEAELSLNAQFAGKGLDMFFGKGKDRGKELNVKGFININKIGEKSARKLYENLTQEKGKSKIGVARFVLDNTMIIKGFNYNLDIGLMDVDVSLGRKAIGYVILVEDIRITRMPIQEYMNNLFGGN